MDSGRDGLAQGLVLACPVTATQTATDLLAALDTAEHTAQTLLGRPLIEDCVDAVTGEVVPIAVVTDNGPAMKSVAGCLPLLTGHLD